MVPGAVRRSSLDIWRRSGEAGGPPGQDGQAGGQGTGAPGVSSVPPFVTAAAAPNAATSVLRDVVPTVHVHPSTPAPGPYSAPVGSQPQSPGHHAQSSAVQAGIANVAAAIQDSAIGGQGRLFTSVHNSMPGAAASQPAGYQPQSPAHPSQQQQAQASPAPGPTPAGAIAAAAGAGASHAHPASTAAPAAPAAAPLPLPTAPTAGPHSIFASVASQPVPILAPALPKQDYTAMLGGEVSSEHSVVLPGYTVGKVIGEGGFCQVRLAIHHLSGRKVAVKIIDKSKLTDANEAKRIQREIRVMRHLSHESVIKLFEVVDAPSMLYLVMEHAPNGSLLDYVRARKRCGEADAAYILQQIVAGLQYCHRREVVHRWVGCILWGWGALDSEGVLHPLVQGRAGSRGWGGHACADASKHEVLN